MIGRDDAREEPVREPERKIAVAADHAAALIHEFAVGEDHARRRFPIEIVPRASDHEPRFPAERGVAPIVDFSGRLIIGHQQADRRLADLA